MLPDRSDLVSTDVHRDVYDVSGNSLSTHDERGVPDYVHDVDERRRTSILKGGICLKQILNRLRPRYTVTRVFGG